MYTKFHSQENVWPWGMIHDSLFTLSEKGWTWWWWHEMAISYKWRYLGWKNMGI